MNVTGNIDFLNQAISSQRAAVSFQVLLASGVFGLGVVSIAFTHLLPHLLPESVILGDLKWPLTLGGTFVSTLSSFPVKEIFTRKDKIAALHFLRQEFERLQRVVTPADTQQIERLEQRFWQFVDKNLTG